MPPLSCRQAISLAHSAALTAICTAKTNLIRKLDVICTNCFAQAGVLTAASFRRMHSCWLSILVQLYLRLCRALSLVESCSLHSKQATPDGIVPAAWQRLRV